MDTPEIMRTGFNKKIKGWEGNGECEAASREISFSFAGPRE